MDQEKGKLYIVATPIGNLDDLSTRAKDTLLGVDTIYAEDTRVTRKLLQAFEASKQIVSYHEHSRPEVMLEILSLLVAGKSVAYVTDAGTPGVSDPGGKLVSFIRSADPTIFVTPIPGPSAIMSALSVCGFDVVPFTFVGFFPKKGRDSFLSKVKKLETAIVFFESPHRIINTLSFLQENLPHETRIFIGRELTKHFETHYFGTISSVLQELQGKSVKGEIVAVLDLKSA